MAALLPSRQHEAAIQPQAMQSHSTLTCLQQSKRSLRRKLRSRAVLAQAALLALAATAAVAWLGDASGFDMTGRHLDEAGGCTSSDGNKITPPNVFTCEQMRYGAVLLMCLLMLYMFLGIAIVCDDYFVASLEVISERWKLSDDVAGATFMAAGGSAPEFATSMLGTFIFESDVGFGTIVGSASFNVLFVIGLCAYFSGQPSLSLTWYPLMRDATFYLICLGVLVGLSADYEVAWYDALALVLLYLVYVLIMKFDAKIKDYVMEKEAKHIRISKAGQAWLTQRSLSKVLPNPIASDSELSSRSEKLLLANRKSTQTTERASISKAAPPATATAPAPAPAVAAVAVVPAKPLEVDVESGDASNAEEMHKEGHKDAIVKISKEDIRQDESLAVSEVGDISESTSSCAPEPVVVPGTAVGGGRISSSDGDEMAISAEVNREMIFPTCGRVRPPMTPDVPSPQPFHGLLAKDTGGAPESMAAPQGAAWPMAMESKETPTRRGVSISTLNDEPEAPKDNEEDEPSVFPEIPRTCCGFIAFCLKAPLVYAFALTIPNCAIGSVRKWYMLTFTACMAWIALLTYVMVWMAEEIGATLGIPEAVMGVTVLAAGTSIPDALSSVLVAREGHGDMALSSSIGSNVFDITFGLPIPWLLATVVVRPGSVISITSVSLPIQVGTLMGMVVIVVGSINLFKWSINKPLGVFFFCLYIIFVSEAVLLELCMLPVC